MAWPLFAISTQEVVRRRDDLVDDDQSLLRQRTHGPIRDVELLHQVLAQDRAAGVEERPQHAVLLLEDGLAVQLLKVGLRHAIGRRQHRDRAAAPFAFHRGRQYSTKSLAPGAGVVVCDPPRQLKQLLIEDRLVVEHIVEHIVDGLEAALGDVRLGRRRRHDRNFATSREADRYAYAGHDLARELLGDRVGVLAPHRPVERDFGVEDGFDGRLLGLLLRPLRGLRLGAALALGRHGGLGAEQPHLGPLPPQGIRSVVACPHTLRRPICCREGSGSGGPSPGTGPRTTALQRQPQKRRVRSSV